MLKTRKISSKSIKPTNPHRPTPGLQPQTLQRRVSGWNPTTTHPPSPRSAAEPEGATQTLAKRPAHPGPRSHTREQAGHPAPSQTALHPGRAEHLLADNDRRPRTHPAAVNGSRAAGGLGWRRGGLRRAPGCASSPKNSTAVTALPMVNQSRICSPVSLRSMMAAARD